MEVDVIKFVRESLWYSCNPLYIVYLYYFYLHWQEKQRKMHEEQRELMQQQVQIKAQMLRHEDELARKRTQVQTAKSIFLPVNWNLEKVSSH